MPTADRSSAKSKSHNRFGGITRCKTQFRPKNPLMRKVQDLLGNCPEPSLALMLRIADVRLAFFSETRKLGGSHKIHLVVQHFYDAIETGRLRAGGAVVIPSSGSTGITTAAVSRLLGIGCTVIVPEGTSGAKLNLLSQAGAKIETEPSLDACVKRARAVAAESNCFLLDQFAPAPTGLSGKSMPQLHFQAVKNHFGRLPNETILAFGTGVTELEFRRDVTRRGLGVEITDAAVEGGVSMPFYCDGDSSARGQISHKIEGVNTVFVPNSACRMAVDRSEPIPPVAAFATCLELGESGLHCGPSSGLAAYCALARAHQRQGTGPTLISVPVFDAAVRYPDTLLNDAYLASLEPELSIYRRQIRVFIKAEYWMRPPCCACPDKLRVMGGVPNLPQASVTA